MSKQIIGHVVALPDNRGYLKEIDTNGRPIFTPELRQASLMKDFEATLQSSHLARHHCLFTYPAAIETTTAVIPLMAQTEAKLA